MDLDLDDPDDDRPMHARDAAPRGHGGVRTMRTIGLLGGMSWESSVEYERLMTDEVRRRLGPSHSASMVIRSYDFAEIEALQEAGDWQEAGWRLAADARALEAAGAEVLVLCTNTMHRVADEIEAAVGIPFLHIADATAEAVRAAGVRRVGLLGTRYTMEQDFYRGRLEARHGFTVLVPGEPDRTVVHDVIYVELVRGVIREESRAAYLAVIDRLVDRGAEGIIAGCTEIEQLVRPEDVAVPYFPTTRLHALAAVEWALR
jgi:aspartate racemase